MMRKTIIWTIRRNNVQQLSIGTSCLPTTTTTIKKQLQLGGDLLRLKSKKWTLTIAVHLKTPRPRGFTQCPPPSSNLTLMRTIMWPIILSWASKISWTIKLSRLISPSLQISCWLRRVQQCRNLHRGMPPPRGLAQANRDSRGHLLRSQVSTRSRL